MSAIECSPSVVRFILRVWITLSSEVPLRAGALRQRIHCVVVWISDSPAIKQRFRNSCSFISNRSRREIYRLLCRGFYGYSSAIRNMHLSLSIARVGFTALIRFWKVNAVGVWVVFVPFGVAKLISHRFIASWDMLHSCIAAVHPVLYVVAVWWDDREYFPRPGHEKPSHDRR